MPILHLSSIRHAMKAVDTMKETLVQRTALDRMLSLSMATSWPSLVENVCALVKGDIETPNDISGVAYVLHDQHGAWKLKIVTELRACGYSISRW